MNQNIGKIRTFRKSSIKTDVLDFVKEDEEISDFIALFHMGDIDSPFGRSKLVERIVRLTEQKINKELENKLKEKDKEWTEKIQKRIKQLENELKSDEYYDTEKQELRYIIINLKNLLESEVK